MLSVARGVNSIRKFKIDGGKVPEMCPNLVKRKLIRWRREINKVAQSGGLK